MISQRRIRVLIVTTLAVFILYLHYSGESQSVQNQKFYQSTVAAINAEKANTGNAGAGHHPPNTNKEQPDEGYTYVDRGDDKQEPAIPKAQPEVQEQPKAPEDQDTEEIPIAGRTKMTVPKGKDQGNGRAGAEAEAEAEAENVPTKDKEDEQEKKKQQELEDEQAKVKAELNGILKRSPIIIFSKSYCPFSKKAKTILLEKYSIVPAPFVVELDQHPLGSQLQALLGENTGRQTVPNILVNGRSIGGGDDIVALDDHEELASRLKSLGSKWLQEVKLRETGSAD